MTCLLLIIVEDVFGLKAETRQEADGKQVEKWREWWNARVKGQKEGESGWWKMGMV